MLAPAHALCAKDSHSVQSVLLLKDVTLLWLELDAFFNPQHSMPWSSASHIGVITLLSTVSMQW